jgi:hypothetical protein
MILMKSPVSFAILLLSLNFVSEAVAQVATLPKKEDLRVLGPLPDDRKPELPIPTDRNPFQVVSKKVNLEQPSADSENSRIYRILKDWPISGIVNGRDGMKVMFGRDLFKEGDELPQLVQQQVSKQRISKLTDTELEVSWVENDPNVQPLSLKRKINVGSGAFRQQLSKDLVVHKKLNGETVQPEAKDSEESSEESEETALRKEAMNNRLGNATPSNQALAAPLR